ncbi:MAG: VOC family protein [Pseudomonadota bacterium]
MQVQLEHANITVSDPDATAALLGRLFGWSVRWSGPALNGGRSVHVGTDTQYLALYAPKAPDAASGSKNALRNLNHVGVTVDDLDAVEARVLAEGFQTTNHDDYEPGRRYYFEDHDGIEWEVVSYA